MNELRYLSLKETRVRDEPTILLRCEVDVRSQVGIEIDIPAATILSIFGLRAEVSHYHDLCYESRF